MFLHTSFCHLRPQVARAKQDGQSGKVTAVINIKLKEAMKIILKSTKQIKKENGNNKKKKQNKLELQNIVLQKFTKELSIFGALSRGCRFCDFL